MIFGQAAAQETAAISTGADPAIATAPATTAIAPMSPLAPAATASPRQTFQSFRTLAQGAADSLVRAFKVSDENEEILDTDEVRALKRQALARLRRAATTLDLSNIPPANRRSVGITSVLLLEEIMDRIPLPAADTIPSVGAVDDGAAPNGWTLPGTEIRMARVTGTDGEPRFLFSPETIAQLPAYYATVAQLPRNSDDAIDFYQHFVTGPGMAMPVALYRHVLEFPDWLMRVHYEQAVWQWFALAIATVLTAALIALLLRWEGRRNGAGYSILRSLWRLVPPLVIIAILGTYEWLVDDVVNLTGSVLASIELGVESLQTVALAFTAVMAFNLLAEIVITSPRVRRESLDASLIRLVFRVIGLGVAAYVLILGASRIGIPVYGLIAGLGVSGLAIALAVRPTLENFIGGIILYADRPVKVGDFCKFGDMLGTVETIGLRSTKVRGLDRTLVTVQNAEFAQMSIVNFTRRDANLMHTTISLRYETSTDQLTAIIDDIAAMLRADDRVETQSVRVCFRGFGEFSLNVEIWAYIRSADWGQFLKIQEQLFMRVMEIVAANGSAFAIPAQTTYLSRDHALTAEPARPREGREATGAAPTGERYAHPVATDEGFAAT
ncbi:mechanosensitive ion channel family protein [Acuticoccus kandeliae]|uniref:mechanosensitive ion channel family protein n=1 Tax=Acuticoccus kandeliae TaxID=2073160 RepID=UPI000D3E0E82|nr:mechanosensitive ion channel family protein [Acuticoccus kandeliae]